jgi:hypothetical protein
MQAPSFDHAPSPGKLPMGCASPQGAEQFAPHTRLQARIRKPKIYPNVTIRYGNSINSKEPGKLSSALSDPNWKAVMDFEFSTLACNKTWHLVPPTNGSYLIDCKWVYKIKRKADDSIDRHKARLVAKGYKQHYDID